MGLMDLFGWFTQWPLLFWLAVVGVVLVWLWRRESEIVTGIPQSTVSDRIRWLTENGNISKIGTAPSSLQLYNDWRFGKKTQIKENIIMVVMFKKFSPEL